MGIDQLARLCLGRFGKSVRLCACLTSVVVMMAAVFVSAGSALADGDSARESLKGGLLDRENWAAAFYRRKTLDAKSRTQVADARAVSQNARSVTKANAKAKAKKAKAAQAQRRRSARLRKARIEARRKARAARRALAKRRIPQRIIKRRERKIARSSGKLRRQQKRRTVKVASLGVDVLAVPSVSGKRKKRRKSVTGGAGRVQWVANSRCVPRRLRNAINYVARNFGRVRVNSTCRSRRHNRRVGGASRSYHLISQAADFRVFGNIGKAARYLRRVVGGYKHYGRGLFHIDTGPRRTWR